MPGRAEDGHSSSMVVKGWIPVLDLYPEPATLARAEHANPGSE